MKILLIYPYCLEERIQREEVSVAPIGLYYVAATLRERGHDVELYNWHDRRDRRREITALLREKRPRVIGFSILQANRWGGIDIAGWAKQIDPSVRVVFGGIGATFLWHHFLKHFPQIDYVVIGEGEIPFLALIESLTADDEDAAIDIAGLAFRRQSDIVGNPPPPPIATLDRLPDPARSFAFQHVALSRGCPGNCTFCGSPHFWQRRVRFHSSGYFLDQLARLNRQGVTYFYFSDDTFTAGRKRALDVCRGIIARGLDINWQAIARVGDVDEELLYWMRRAGCVLISYGVESGSAEIRRRLGKPLNREQIERAFGLTVKYGILARAYFIYGCPGESWETIAETVALMETVKPLSAIFYILDIFPGTALYEDFKRRCGVDDAIWLNRIEDILYFETDPRLTQADVLAFGKHLRQRFHQGLPDFVAAIDLVDDRQFYPLHADFCSRLGLTFAEGEYAGIDAIGGEQRIAESLYHKALAYHPDARAYLGLGLLAQKKRDYPQSIRLLRKGLEHFPDDRQLTLCLGVAYLNTGRYRTALSHFLRFSDAPEAIRYAAHCYRALGDGEQEADCLKRLQP
jgi:radical SAM superfamily enzyme YgiQ (UPF0313 family)